MCCTSEVAEAVDRSRRGSSSCSEILIGAGVGDGVRRVSTSTEWSLRNARRAKEPCALRPGCRASQAFFSAANSSARVVSARSSTDS